MEMLHTLFFFVVAIGILISFHEFGHFWVARKTGVKVLRFSVGFGKVLWSRQKNPDDTEYVLSAIPLGGYVKMVDEREGEVKPEDLPFAFNRQPLWVRTAIVVAGPAFNIMLAIALFWSVLVLGETGLRPILGEVKQGTLAATAGFVEGEEIISVGDKPSKTWTEAMSMIIASAMDGEPIIKVKTKNLADEQNDRMLKFTESDVQDSEKLYDRLGFKPWSPKLQPIINEVLPNGAALAAGLKKDDLIISADGKAIADWMQWVDYVKKRPDITINLTIDRQGMRLTLPITPKSEQVGEGTEGKIGASVLMPEGLMKSMTAEYSLPPLEAIPVAFKTTYDYSIMTLKMMGKMLVGKASVKNLSGPISIAQIAGQSASMGMVHFIKFMALVSVSLGILNLLPIPVLDGGHLLFFGVEAIKGSPVPEKAQLFFQQIGMALLLLLMATAMVVDVQRLFD
ncbi:membrane-associated zinc metalloprotease [Methyloglobulus morosus KoM1]|uniref:Zinc metalloprotease n=1 Tax=Methyloglobulus morosus KoM1 TaxID=1116472 RepID=V5BYS7_9GAMM|nr:RIP metalloprotease RseP [Methyloglobulus morosus]ESS71412.1 membrane-associated zinc metalloprotease [Methyloglobulus morosus KoM1]